LQCFMLSEMKVTGKIVSLSRMGFELLEATAERDGGVGGQVGRVGMVVLATDHTLEMELCSILHPLGVGLFFSRVPMVAEVTPDSLASMRERIYKAAELILPGVRLDMLGYGCTSASAVLGEEVVFSQLASRERKARFTTPATAASAAFRALGSRKVGLVTPYVGEVNNLLVAALEKQGGVEVTALLTFNLCLDHEVAGVTPASMIKAGMEVGSRDDVDTVFISCTSLRTSTVAAELESRLGKSVTSSNLCLAWHILANLPNQPARKSLDTRYGKLFALDLPE